MNYITIIGLIIHIVCISVLWHKFRWAMFQYPGSLFLLMVSVYHGLLPETLNAIFPGRNDYREMVSPESIGSTVLLFSIAVLIYLVFYIAGLRRTAVSFQLRQEAVAKANTMLLSNRIYFIIFTLICYVISFFYLSSSAFDNVDITAEYWSYGLATYLLPHLLLITTISIIMSYHQISIQHVLLVQIIMNIIALSRGAVLFSLMISIIVVTSLGYSLKKRHLYALFSVALSILILISITRGIFGREELTVMTPFERIQSVTNAGVNMRGNIGEYVLDDFIYRFDGNSSNGLILESFNYGSEPIGFKPIINDLMLQIPRVLDPTKLESDLMTRNSEALIYAYYGFDPTIDYTQGWLGYLLGCFGISGLLIAMVFLGLSFAKLDTWLVNTERMFSIPLYYFIIYNIIYYEGVLPGLLGSMRVMAVIMSAMLVFHFIVNKTFVQKRFAL